MNTNALALSQLIGKNPVLKEKKILREEYFNYLQKYIKQGGLQRNKLIAAQLEVYKKVLQTDQEGEGIFQDIESYRIFLLVDLLQILGYDEKIVDSDRMVKVLTQYYIDFPEMMDNQGLVTKIIMTVHLKDRHSGKWSDKRLTVEEKEYIGLMRENILFMKEKPFNVMVTATMSAGKSTFINALTGKYISLTQNMACTSKIHTIIGKPFEDDFSYEYDHDLVMTAGREELLEDNEKNATDNIMVSTYYDGLLGGKRIVIKDSPGVNFSGDSEHKEISDKLLKARRYNLLIYLMNATQFATNDENEHLEYVRGCIGRTPILFVVNKIDALDPDEEDVFLLLENQRRYLEYKGFKNPVICPVSSAAAYLSKLSSKTALKRLEKRELYAFVDKFEEMKLPGYYRRNFANMAIKNAGSEEEQLLKTSGFAYVEKMIILISEGGRVNGTGLR